MRPVPDTLIGRSLENRRLIVWPCLSETVGDTGRLLVCIQHPLDISAGIQRSAPGSWVEMEVGSNQEVRLPVCMQMIAAHCVPRGDCFSLSEGDPHAAPKGPEVTPENQATD